MTIRFFQLRDLLDRPVSNFALDSDDTGYGRGTWEGIVDHVQEIANTDDYVSVVETSDYAENDRFYREIITIDAEPRFFLVDSPVRF
jgi:hypothetical protein